VIDLQLVTIAGASIDPTQIAAIEGRRSNGEDRTFVHLRSGGLLDLPIQVGEFRDLLVLRVNELNGTPATPAPAPAPAPREGAMQAVDDAMIGEVTGYLSPGAHGHHHHGGHS
jgi:hypothetical protein